MAVSWWRSRRPFLWLLPRIYAMLARVLFASCRLRVCGREHLDRCDARDSPMVAAFWHYSVLAIIELHRQRVGGWAAMVSASGDAEYVARLLARRGVRLARGSRHRGGVRALKELLGLMAGGCSAAIVADGSQGPPRRAQPGAVLLASRAGAPILPMVVAADRYWAFGSWDRTLLPKPFSRLFLCYGEPLEVPAGLTAGRLESYRQELEERLNDLYRLAWTRAGREKH